jgi:predicted nucleic acid-binding protein
MYFLGSRTGWHGQETLWNLLGTGSIAIHVPQDGELKRMRDLMEKYKNVPMAFADASLAVASEALGLLRVFTLDDDFRVYRANENEPFEVIP